MKKSFYLLPLLALAIALSSFTIPARTLVGKWKGEDNGDIGYITFDKKGYVSFTFNGETIGGKKYEVEGMVMDMFYETDESVHPHTMDFVIKTNKEKTEIARLVGVYEYVNDKTINVNMNFLTDERPVLDPEDKNQITLTKVK